MVTRQTYNKLMYTGPDLKSEIRSTDLKLTKSYFKVSTQV